MFSLILPKFVQSDHDSEEALGKAANIASKQEKFRSLATKFSVFTASLLVWVIAVSVVWDIRQRQFSPGKGVLMLALMLLIALWIARFTIRLLVRPLALLEQGLRSVGEGRLEPVEYSRTNDEIEYLGASFNRMIEKLAASQAEIHQHQELLEERIRQRTEALEEAMQRALAASRAKSEFLANMSHELRTPMHGFLGMIEIVLDSKLTSEQREQLETAQRCAFSLLALLNDVLDLSKIESGRMVLEKIPFDLRCLIEDCVKSQLPKAIAKGIKLSSEIEGSIPSQVLGDPLRLRQIVMNLLTNAVKFTESGAVAVNLRSALPRDKGRLTVELEVADTGTGIPRDKLPLIFDKFTQADGSISRKYGGTGLGLAITKKLVDLHGGQIAVESEQEHGSRFAVKLDFELGSKDGPGASAQEQWRAPFAIPPTRHEPALLGRILLVEDNLVNQRVVASILRKKGYRVTVTNNGREALNELHKRDFGLVIMDVQMPEVDGLETTRRIRREPRWRDLPIVAMTAYAMTGDREKCLAAGMNAYLSKPVHSALLLSTVETYIKASSGDGSTCEADEPVAFPAIGPAEFEPSPIDPNLAARFSDSDSSLMESMVTVFLQVAPERIHNLHTAAARGNRTAIMYEAQQLRHAAADIAATSIAASAKRVEDVSVEGEMPAVKHSLLLLEKEIRRLNRHQGLTESPLERSGSIQ